MPHKGIIWGIIRKLIFMSIEWNRCIYYNADMRKKQHKRNKPHNVQNGTYIKRKEFCDGKTIIPFTTHGGSGFSSNIETIAQLQPDAEVITEGLSISRESVADSGEEIRDWVDAFQLTSGS